VEEGGSCWRTKWPEQFCFRKKLKNYSRYRDIKSSHNKQRGKFKRTFVQQMEKQLTEHCKDLDDRQICLTRESLQEMAFKLAERKGITRPFKNNKARRACAQGFVANNTDIPGKICIPYTISAVAKYYCTMNCSTVIPSFIHKIISSNVTCAEPLFCVDFSKHFNVSTLHTSVFHSAPCYKTVENRIVLLINVFPPWM
jgi:hypothetical protein